MTLNAGKTNVKITYTPRGTDRLIGYEVPKEMSTADALNKILLDNPEGVIFKRMELYEFNSKGLKTFYF
jgi:hypothetical protein